MEPPLLEESESASPPGFWWIGLLAVPWFLAGYVGPAYFVPDSNIAPVIGIVISGPAGLVAGLVLFLIFRLIRVSARMQWLMLGIISVSGTVATLVLIQPEPKATGVIVEVEVTRLLPIPQVAPEIIDHWRRRVAEVTWAAPRAGWEKSMEAALARDPRFVMEAVLLRERIVKVTRKPWDRGRLIALPWYAHDESPRYTLSPQDVPPDLAPGSRVFLFLPGLVGDPRPSGDWPPLGSSVPYQSAEALPALYEQFK